MIKSTQSERQAFFDWIQKTIPSIDDYFGLDHLKQFVKDGLSVGYTRYFDMWKVNPDAVKGSFIARLTGINPLFASYMAKEQNSGDSIRGEIAVIQTALNQTMAQITMWQDVLTSAAASQQMKTFAQSLLNSFIPQAKQISDTLILYQKDLSDGIAKGIYK